MPILIGIAYGAFLGYVTNLILFRKMENNRMAGVEPLKGIGGVFLTRYFLDLIALILFYLVTRHALGLVAAALSITVAVKISLYIVYMRKGGRFD